MKMRQITTLIFLAVLAVIAQMPLGPAVVAEEGSLIDYGEMWRQSSPEGRMAFVVGYLQSTRHFYRWLQADLFEKDTKVTKTDSQAKLARTMETMSELSAAHSQFNPNKIANVMAELYSAPSNSYVNLDRMLAIAVQKQKGADVDELLQQARRAAVFEQCTDRLLAGKGQKGEICTY